MQHLPIQHGLAAIILATVNWSVAADPIVDVVILAGQSNMVGGASVSDLPDHLIEYVEVNDQVVMRSWLNGTTVENGWTHLAPRNGTSFGPEMMLGHELSTAFPDRSVAFIKIAANGTNMDCDWNPVNCGQNMFWHLMTKVETWTTELEEIGFDVRIAALAWVQGEADSRAEWCGNAYGAHLSFFIDRVRYELQEPALPMLIAKVQPRDEDYSFFNLVHEGMEEVAREDERVSTVSCAAMPLRDDLIHFNPEGMLQLGAALADGLRTMGVFKDSADLSCAGDLNADGSVNANDLLSVLEVWGPCP